MLVVDSLTVFINAEVCIIARKVMLLRADLGPAKTSVLPILY